MDSRVHPERMFNLDIGDAEIIRNAGGRVTADVIRSLLVAQELLGCDTVIVMHHTGEQLSSAVHRCPGGSACTAVLLRIADELCMHRCLEASACTCSAPSDAGGENMKGHIYIGQVDGFSAYGASHARVVHMAQATCLLHSWCLTWGANPATVLR